MTPVTDEVDVANMYLAAEQRQLSTAENIEQNNFYAAQWPTYALILLSDIVSLLLAGVLSFWTVTLINHAGPPLRSFLSVQIILSVLGLIFLGLYPGIAIHPVHELKRAFSAVALVYLTMAACAVFHPGAVSGLEIGLAVCALLAAPLLVLLRALVRSVFRDCRWWGVPAVLITTHQGGSGVFKAFNQNRGIGLRIVAVLQDDNEWLIEPGKRDRRIITGRLDLAPHLASSYKISHAIIALNSLSSTHVLPIIERYAGKYRHVHLMPHTGLLASISVYAKDLGGLLSLELSQVLLHTMPQMFKRVFDTVVGITLSILLLPLLIVLFVSIKLTSPGPALYGSRRVGLNGEIFTAWKFRSMVINSEQILLEHLNNNPAQRELWEKHLKLKNDPRVTALGKLLRRLSLDELPQLWNVITGEMSLVGPRPILPHEMERYCGGLALYSRVRPGVTGFWQVSGRNDTSFEERRMLDEYYVRNWSPWLDLYILGRTVGTLLWAKGSWV